MLLGCRNRRCTPSCEGAVHLPVGGPDGVPIARLRRMYGLTIAEVAAAEDGVPGHPR
ncbi:MULTISPECIES: hypothetical protein [unclassified Streptomyces]|uniref:hypothetical protein n=1 Tax=unclassified Streptomyces TaxID=2593676 RepID=UPI002E2C858D|nr:hypothetical protein [Streptomyces sp. NBC_01439]